MDQNHGGTTTTTTTTQRILGSVVAGTASTVLGHPLDTVKTHLQTDRRRWLSSGTAEVFRTLGPKGVFRGIGPPLVNAIIMNSIMFTVFDAVDSAVGDPFVAGILSGFATAVVSTPADRFKIRLQLGEPLRRRTAGGGGGESSRFGFLRNLYRGFALNLAREGIFTMVYLGIYHRVMADLEITTTTTGSAGGGGFERLAAVAGTSALTGAAAWIASYPFDVAKTAVQRSDGDGGGDLRSVRAAIRRRDIRWLYRGCLPSTGRAMLVTSSRMIAYDAVIRWLRFREEE